MRVVQWLPIKQKNDISKVTSPRNVISTNLTPQTTYNLEISLPLPHFTALMLWPGTWGASTLFLDSINLTSIIKFGYRQLSLLRACDLVPFKTVSSKQSLICFIFSPSKWKKYEKKNEEVTKSPFFIQTLIFPCNEMICVPISCGEPQLWGEHTSTVWPTFIFAPQPRGQPQISDFPATTNPFEDQNLQAPLLTNAPVPKRPNHSRQLLGAILAWQLTEKLSQYPPHEHYNLISYLFPQQQLLKPDCWLTYKRAADT